MTGSSSSITFLEGTSMSEAPSWTTNLGLILKSVYATIMNCSLGSLQTCLLNLAMKSSRGEIRC